MKTPKNEDQLKKWGSSQKMKTKKKLRQPQKLRWIIIKMYERRVRVLFSSQCLSQVR